MSGAVRRLSEEQLRARAEELSRQLEAEGDAAGGEVGLLALRLGREWHGLPVRWAQEVILRPKITPVPLAPACVAGAINLRGEIVGVVDLAALFGLAKSAAAGPFVVVVRVDDLEAAFAVEDITEVLWLSSADRESVVSTVPRELSGYFAGAFRTGDRLVAELDAAKILQHPELLKLRNG